jgi:hypothetical protein
MTARAEANNATATWTAPAGWTLLVQNTTTIGTALFAKFADAADVAASSFTFTRATNLVNPAVVVIDRFTGAGSIQAADIAGGTGTTIVLPSINAAAGFLWQSVNRVSGTSGWTPPGTATERYDLTSGGSAAQCAGGDETVAAGATGTRTWTSTSGNSRGSIISINPIPTLAPDDTANGHASESPILTQVHVLSPADSAHADTADSPTLTQVHVIAPADSAHPHVVGSPALTQVHQLGPADSVHMHTSESQALTQVHLLQPADTVHSHASESPQLSAVTTLAPDGSLHAHATESATVTQLHLLTPVDSVHAHATGSPVLEQVHVIAPADCLHVHATRSPVLTIPVETPPERTSVATAAPRTSTASSSSRTSTATAAPRISSN